MLSKEDNQLLTRVGPGTPGGELLRRYWQPVALAPELTEESPTKFVRLLGEDLVLFKDRGGRVGLLADHCPHRGASLLYGRVEQRGIACAYHGWLYDVEGNCLETPAEPADSKLYLTVKQRAYPVQEYCGLHWAYLGPEPAPILPRIDIVEMGTITAVGEVPREDCNWLQVVENNLDQAHVFILHQDTSGRRGPSVTSTTRGGIDLLDHLEYHEDAFGIVRQQVHKNGYVELDLMIFPQTQRLLNHFSVKVPIDDTHTKNYRVFVDLMLDGNGTNGVKPKANGHIDYYIESTAEGKSPADATHPLASYRMDMLRFQDFMVLETQGPLADREHEHLGTSDRGVVLLRDMLKREIEKVQRGLDPIGVIRDQADSVIHTHTETLGDDRRARWPEPQGIRISGDRQPASL